jgi:hypothetical protein
MMPSLLRFCAGGARLEVPICRRKPFETALREAMQALGRAPAAQPRAAAVPAARRRGGALPAAVAPARAHPACRRTACTVFSSSAAAATADVSDPVTLRVAFSLRVRVAFGDVVKVVGSHPSLGEWDVSRAVAMHWSAGDVWKGTAELPEHFVVRYKARGAAAAQRSGGRCSAPARACGAQRAPATPAACAPPDAPGAARPRALHHVRSSSSSARTARCSGSRAKTAQRWRAAPLRASLPTPPCRWTSSA